MWMYYLVACIPPVIGAVLWVKTREVVWWEWLGSAALGFIVAGIIHALVMFGMTSDVETWSGKISYAVHYPRWVEEYTKTHTRTVGSGKNARTETYTTIEHRTHPEHWVAFLGFGSAEEEREISREFFSEIVKSFGGQVDTISGRRPGFDGGDRNDYHAKNRTGYIYPVTTTKTFENRVKCAPSVFSYVEVPENSPVYDWPENEDWRHSNRLLGSAKNGVTLYEWDCMNTRLGASKKVNVILIGFGERDASVAQLQEAKWIGGKKNDLVLCYGGSNEKPSWAVVFGWTEREIVKRNLEAILLENPVNNDLIPKIEAEIRANYVIKDWSKFDYIDVTPPWWGIIVLIVVMAVLQVGFMVWAFRNGEDKDVVENHFRK